MRQYRKPRLTVALFDPIDDIITASTPDPVSGGSDIENPDWASAPESVEYVNDLTVENPLGTFNPHVTGGNPVQEALNTLYENFVDRV